MVVRRCQQSVGELDVVGDLGAYLATREVAEIAAQGRRRLDGVGIDVARCVRRDDDHREVVAKSARQTFHRGHRCRDGLATCASDLGNQDRRVGTDTSLHGRYLPM